MPSSRGTSKRPRRALRCAYREDGRQCPRNALAESNPPLCRAHQVILGQVGAPPAQRGSAIVDVLGEFLSGGKVTRDQVSEAFNEAAQAFGIGGGIAQGYYPDIDPNTNRTRHDSSGSQRVRWWEVFREVHERARQANPATHEAQVAAAARRRARVVLGFAATEPIVKEQVERRRRDLARRHHPDLTQDPKEKAARQEKMIEVNASADILLAELEDA